MGLAGIAGPIALVTGAARRRGIGRAVAFRLAREGADVNLKGTWMVARACVERMIAAGRRGRIVNVSSQAGKRGFPLLGAYAQPRPASSSSPRSWPRSSAPRASPSTPSVRARSTPTCSTRTGSSSSWSAPSREAWSAGWRARSRSAGLRRPTTSPRDRVPVQRRRSLRHGRGAERQRRPDDGVRSAGFQYSRHQTMRPSR